MLLPEGQRAGGHYVGAVAVGLLDARFGVVAGAVNHAAADALLRGRYEHLRLTQRTEALQVGGLRAAEQVVKEVVEALFFRQSPGGCGHADDGAGPLLHRPRPAVGGGVVRLVNHQQVVGVIPVPDLPAGGAAAYGLGHQDDGAARPLRERPLQ